MDIQFITSAQAEPPPKAASVPPVSPPLQDGLTDAPWYPSPLESLLMGILRSLLCRICGSVAALLVGNFYFARHFLFKDEKCLVTGALTVIFWLIYLSQILFIWVKTRPKSAYSQYIPFHDESADILHNIQAWCILHDWVFELMVKKS